VCVVQACAGACALWYKHDMVFLSVGACVLHLCACLRLHARVRASLRVRVCVRVYAAAFVGVCELIC